MTFDYFLQFGQQTLNGVMFLTVVCDIKFNVLLVAL